MAITLSLAAPDLDDEDLQALTRNLVLTINRETDLQADLVTRPVEPGERSAAGVDILGLVVIPILTGLTAGALMELLKPLFTRSKSMVVRFKKDDLEFEIRDDDLTQMERILERLKEFEGE